MIFEVFRQERKGQAFQHAGSVEAPDEQFAEAYAREQYGRRGESAALWVVERGAIHPIEDFQDPRQEWRRLFSELVGTFFLVLGAAGRGMMSQAFPNMISHTAAVTAPG